MSNTNNNNKRALLPYEGQTARHDGHRATQKTMFLRVILHVTSSRLTESIVSILLRSHSKPLPVVTECTGQVLLCGNCLVAPCALPTAKRHCLLCEVCSASTWVHTPRDWLDACADDDNNVLVNVLVCILFELLCPQTAPSKLGIATSISMTLGHPPNLHTCVCSPNQVCLVANGQLPCASSSPCSIPSSISPTTYISPIISRAALCIVLIQILSEFHSKDQSVQPVGWVGGP